MSVRVGKFLGSLLHVVTILLGNESLGMELQLMYLRGVVDIMCTGFEESLSDCSFSLEIESVTSDLLAFLDCSSKFSCVILMSSKSSYIIISLYPTLTATCEGCVCFGCACTTCTV